MDYLSSPDVKNALDNIHKDFVVVPIDKATGNIALICKIFYVITRELRLNKNHRLPNIYWMVKMHKNHIKARFI